ncbi:hypothetical protein G5S37_28800 [Roseimicrobium sp. ORNL1]|nr:hypothetical protein G5S37_28800 [Roseimicrobium sp. ORNL1]
MFHHHIASFAGILCASFGFATTGVAEEKAAPPQEIAGSKLEYKDLHGSYVYTFAKDGSYTFAAVHQSGKSEGERKGAYKYAVTPPDKAKLSLDKDTVIALTFEAPLKGKLTVDDDVRPHAFTITPGKE